MQGMQQQIDLKVSKQEAESLIRTLGELPTKSNAFPLMMKIAQQTQVQLKALEEAPAKVDPDVKADVKDIKPDKGKDAAAA